MKRTNVIVSLVMLALLSACKNPAGSNNTITGEQPASYNITVNPSGNVGSDSVTASPVTGKAGDEITLSYTVANDKINNRLVFSGTKAAVAQVDSAGSGTRKYAINAEDAADGVITINAVFSHSDKQFDTIAFADSGNVTKTYGDASFTKAITNTGTGARTITYSSGDPTVASVDSAGAVTILKAGTTTITATKAGDAAYEEATAAYTLTVTKAVGRTVSVPAKASVTETSITINAVAVTAPAYGQTAEYAIATAANPVPTNGWQTGLTFNGLTANTSYYVFARSKENDNCHAGTAQVSAAIKTQEEEGWEPIPVPRETVVDFETDTIGKTYGFTKGNSSPTVTVVADPIKAGQKSVKITSGNYNQAAVIPINLPYELYRYKSFSFRFSLVSGNTGTNLNNQQIMVYAAKSAGDFKDNAFGNPATSSYPQFADRLLGSVPSPAVNFDDTYKNKWTDYTITITNPGDAIKDLKGDIFVAIGINCQNAAEIMFDDLTFTMRDDFNPPPIIPLPTNPPVPASIGAVESGIYRNMFKEARKTQAEIDAKVNTAWNKLFNGTAAEKIYNEVGADMAYIYTADTDDVRSEGMSYGMMMCVQLDKKTEFDKLWKWARTYMYNETNTGNNNRGYFSWKRNTSGTGGDTAAAPDGEFYFTTALLFASARWGDGTGIFNYRQQAKQILYDMVHRTPNGSIDPYSAPTMFNLTNHQPVFVPIGQSANHTDPSYHLPAFYDVWAIELQIDADKNAIAPWSSKAEMETDIEFYKKAAQASRAFFPTTVNATTGLGPDYAEFSGAPTGGNHADFRFDAWRIAMNIAMDYAWWAKDDWQKTFADKIQAFFISKGVSSYGNQWTLSGNQLDSDHSPGLVACNAVASLAATNANAWKFIENFWEIGMTTGTYRYYDGCLYMMGMLHVSGNFKAYLSNNTTITPSAVISPTTATFDKKTGSQADIAVTMTLNGNTLSTIKNGAATLTSGTNYTVSGSVVTIKKEYLATQPEGTATLTFTFSAGASRTIAITVTDTTPSAVISPTTATFDKKTENQADIAVTMTLNGYNFSSVKNGAATLTSGTDYTVSGSTVTIKKEYLAAQSNGTTTLTFNFSAGPSKDIAITISDSGGTVLKYTFETNAADSVVEYNTGSNANTKAQVNTVEKRLEINVGSSYGNDVIILPFNLGTKTLADFASIKIKVAAGNNDGGNKAFNVVVSSTNVFGNSGSSSNTLLANQGGNAIGGYNATTPSWNTHTITLNNITNMTNYTGLVKIGFWIACGANSKYYIESIELIAK